MISFKKIYQLSFYFVVSLIFLIGGMLQFFLGLSNTVLTLLIVAIMYLTYTLYVIIKHRAVVNIIIFWGLVYVVIIIISGISNKSNFFSIIIYFLFPLLPLGAFLFCYINYKENYLSPKRIFKLLYLISLIQLPILIIQSNFYEELIKFNNSNQHIASFDFLFGSFFLKSDHSLGFFILCVITTMLLNIRKDGKLIKLPVISIIYLSVTVFLTESNISKLFLSILLVLSIVIPLYKRYKMSYILKAVVLLFGTLIVLFVYSLRDQEFVKARLGGDFESQYSLSVSERQYELGTAKRGQILIMAFNNLETKWIGDGPYSYFNILTGEFKRTIHFSQLIWTYFDLGFIGLIVVMGLLISILRYLDIDKGIPFYTVLGVVIVYSFYTTVFSDIAIMFSLMMIFNKKSLNEFDNYPISRLEKKP
ncbi:MAG: hypothetical protein COW44_12935 [Flavobacteriaceae bacterium CG17_big_fil_post_rev_8_21_14_2_50_33_15]|nr:MAG: hypothetical protein COW44_12935 [Flavobacteriaceae bacterium CG17_big_fil_post_rev_8_21_14_2_50_33_15]